MPSTPRVELQLRIVSDDDTVIRDEVILQLDKRASETVEDAQTARPAAY
ncbi:hypothetical protein N826_38975 [Skermanella aerolata KACC 11604]|nr:hypothetical protein N826_38975 [Skermanella aerolata KACC 11604]